MVMLAPRETRSPDRSLDRGDVLAALADVPDPEIPAVSIVELGMVGEVEVGERGIRVELLPTFVGPVNTTRQGAVRRIPTSR